VALSGSDRAARGDGNFAQERLKLASPPLRKGVAALPCIADPNAARAKVNSALAREDQLVSKAAAACSGLDDDGHSMFWERTIQIMKRGPALLYLLISDSAASGGVHPFDDAFSLVWDLRTGEVVRWDQVLPKISAEAVKILSQGDSPLIAMRSDRLRAIYVACHKKHDDAPLKMLWVKRRCSCSYPEAHVLQLFPASVSQICQPCADYALQLLPGRKKPLSKGAR